MIALWLAVIAVAYTAIVGGMYPIILDNAEAMEDYLEMFPKEFLAAFGMSGSLADPGVFFTTYIGSFLWPVVAAMGAIVLATRPVAADVERGWSEVTLATPLTRLRSLGSSIVVQALVLAGLAAATVLGLLIAGVVVDAGFDAAHFAIAALVLALFAWAIAGVASLVGSLTLSRGVAAGVTAGILIAMYLVNVVAQLQPDIAWLGDLGAFKYLVLTELIDDGVIPWSSVLVFGVTAIVGWIASGLVFARRDLVA
jgi:ABC-2 type transport system permease protein